MTTFAESQQAPLKKAALFIASNWKAWLPTISIFMGLGMCTIGTIGMGSFILEETLQTQGFGYAIPAMNKQWEAAYASLCLEEPFIQANITALIRLSRYNLLTGRTFKAYASATQRKLAKDKDFFRYMIKKQETETYLKTIGAGK